MSVTRFNIDSEYYWAYDSVIEADRILRVEPELWPTWSDITTDAEKQQLLVKASRVIDRCSFIGDVTQPNKIPGQCLVTPPLFVSASRTEAIRVTNLKVPDDFPDTLRKSETTEIIRWGLTTEIDRDDIANIVWEGRQSDLAALENVTNSTFSQFAGNPNRVPTNMQAFEGGAVGDNGAVAIVYIMRIDSDMFVYILNANVIYPSLPLDFRATVANQIYLCLEDVIQPQPLKWPRTGIEGLDSNTIPEAIEQATAVLAATLHQQTSPETADRDKSIKKVVGLRDEVEYFEPWLLTELENTGLPAEVIAYLTPYLKAPDLIANTKLGGDTVSYDRNFFPDPEYTQYTNNERWWE